MFSAIGWHGGRTGTTPWWRAATVRTLFAQPDRHAAGAQLREVVAHRLQLRAGQRRPSCCWRPRPRSAVRASMACPREHWTRLSSPNPLERLNRELNRRTAVVGGVFPDVPAVIRLVGAVLLELDEAWQVERRSFSQECMRRPLAPEARLEPTAVAPRLAPAR